MLSEWTAARPTSVWVVLNPLLLSRGVPGVPTGTHPLASRKVLVFVHGFCKKCGAEKNRSGEGREYQGLHAGDSSRSKGRGEDVVRHRFPGRGVLLTGWAIAEDNDFPRWKPSTFFFLSEEEAASVSSKSFNCLSTD